MSDQYPKMLFRPVAASTDNALVIEGLTFEIRVVADFDEEEDAHADGWARYDERDTSAAGADLDAPEPEGGETANDVVELLRDELLEADKKLQTRETEINLANDRIATLEAEKAELTEKLTEKLAARISGDAGDREPQDLPALTGKTKAELLDIAAAEGATVEAGSTNADIIAAIELKREAGAAGE